MTKSANAPEAVIHVAINATQNQASVWSSDSFRGVNNSLSQAPCSHTPQITNVGQNAPTTMAEMMTNRGLTPRLEKLPARTIGITSIDRSAVPSPAPSATSKTPNWAAAPTATTSNINAAKTPSACRWNQEESAIGYVGQVVGSCSGGCEFGHIAVRSITRPDRPPRNPWLHDDQEANLGAGLARGEATITHV